MSQPMTPHKTPLETILQHESPSRPPPANLEQAGSLPATPQDAKRQELGDNLSRLLQTTRIAPGSQSVLGTPASARHLTYASGSSFSQPTRSANVFSSPSKQASVKATASSPSVVPAWQMQEFTVRSAPPEDPFVSTQQNKASPINPLKAGITPTKDTAQAIYSPQACIFVANLMQSASDELLENAVTTAFGQFGDVYVKIRRDARQMPFAFAQYTNVEDARRAINLGRGILINGRPCRTEVARVNRSLYMTRVTGGSITEAEARQALINYGSIETLWLPSQTEREIFHLSEGIFVRFAFYDDCRDAQMSFRTSDHFRLEQVKGLEEGRHHALRTPTEAPARRDFSTRITSPAMMRHNADARTIFIGKLPAQFTEEQLCSQFRIYGRVVRCEIVRKSAPLVLVNTDKTDGHAFVEFDRPQSAALAVQNGHLQPPHLHVEFKEPTMPYTPGSFSGSPSQFDNIGSQELLAAFQRGVSLGINQAAHVQMMAPPPVFPPFPFTPPVDPSFAPGTSDPNGKATANQTAYHNPNTFPQPAYGYPLTPMSPPYGHFASGQPPFVVFQPDRPRWHGPETPKMEKPVSKPIKMSLPAES